MSQAEDLARLTERVRELEGQVVAERSACQSPELRARLADAREALAALTEVCETLVLWEPQTAAHRAGIVRLAAVLAGQAADHKTGPEDGQATEGSPERPVMAGVDAATESAHVGASTTLIERGRGLAAVLVELARWSAVAFRDGDLHARVASALALWNEAGGQAAAEPAAEDDLFWVGVANKAAGDLADAQDALRTLRDAWNAHMETCPQLAALPDLAAPTWEQLREWESAPSNTASSALPVDAEPAESYEGSAREAADIEEFDRLGRHDGPGETP